MDKTKNELALLKEKLNLLSTTYLDKLENVDKQEEKWKLLEDRAKEILQQNPEEIIRLNVGGTLFTTRTVTLLSAPNSLFTKLLAERRAGKDDLFIDRCPELFSYVLQFLRTGKINIKKLKKEELYEDFLEEAKYFEIFLSKNQSPKEVKLSAFSVNSFYTGSPSSLTVLEDRNLNSAILTNSPGWMILELDKECDIEEIEIGGYTGDQAWNNPTGYGAGATISTSSNKSTWTTVGSIPSGFGNKIMNAKLTSTYGKFIKFECNSWLAIGFVNVIV
jgi:hypothetical protein